MAPLLQQLANSIPAEFRLPEEIRTHFKDGISPFVIFPFSSDWYFQLAQVQKGHIWTRPGSNLLA
jgi:hypothetical protein